MPQGNSTFRDQRDEGESEKDGEEQSGGDAKETRTGSGLQADGGRCLRKRACSAMSDDDDRRSWVRPEN